MLHVQLHKPLAYDSWSLMEEDGGQSSLAEKASWHLTRSSIHANPSQDTGMLSGGLSDHRILLCPFQGLLRALLRPCLLARTEHQQDKECAYITYHKDN